MPGIPTRLAGRSPSTWKTATDFAKLKEERSRISRYKKKKTGPCGPVVSFVQELHHLVVLSLTVEGYVLESDKSVGLIEGADLLVGGFTVKEREPAADLFKYQLYLCSCDGKNIIQVDRVFFDRMVFADLPDQVPDYFVFLKEKTGKFSALPLSQSVIESKNFLCNGKIRIEQDSFRRCCRFSVPEQICTADIGDIIVYCS